MSKQLDTDPSSCAIGTIISRVFVHTVEGQMDENQIITPEDFDARRVESSLHGIIADWVTRLLNEGKTDVHRTILAQVELDVLAAVVEHCNGSYLRASRILGISRTTLRKKIGRKSPSGKPSKLEAALNDDGQHDGSAMPMDVHPFEFKIAIAK
jgi:DNA-binding protein Fis